MLLNLQTSGEQAVRQDTFPKQTFTRGNSKLHQKRNVNQSSEVIKVANKPMVNKKKVTRRHQTSLFTRDVDANLSTFKLSEVRQKEEPLFSSEKFTDLSLHPHLVSCLQEKFNMTYSTVVQQRTIPVLLSGKDALVKSLTGSGKTMAYAIPIIQQLQEVQPKLKRSDGIFAVIVVPTRELAVQSYECFQGLCRSFTWIVPGCLMGGEKKKSEKARLRKGITVLVCTPGRLTDHMDHTASLNLTKVRWLVIDEADRLVDLGFEKSVSYIIEKLNVVQEVKRQTVLLSATLSKGIEELAGLALDNPSIIDVAASSESNAMVTDEFVVPKTLKQFYILTPVKLRLVILSAFIVEKCSLGNTKAIVFMATQDMVDFHFLLFEDVLKETLSKAGFEIQVFKLHGNMKQHERMEVFKEFRSVKSGTLLCTDVAARGLDLPQVDWIVQFNAPSRPEDYIHRVGRTARIGSDGQSLIFLLPSETKFLEILQSHKMNLMDISFQELLKSLRLIVHSEGKKALGMEDLATYLQNKYEKVVYQNEVLLEVTRKAYTSFVRSYSSYPKAMKVIFPFKSLHLGHLAKSFCLQESPSELGLKVSCKFLENRKRFPRKDIRKFNNRKRNISEFDSGLQSFKRSKKSMSHD